MWPAIAAIVTVIGTVVMAIIADRKNAQAVETSDAKNTAVVLAMRLRDLQAAQVLVAGAGSLTAGSDAGKLQQFYVND